MEDLVPRTRIRDVLVQRIDGELRRTPPADVDVRLTTTPPWYHVEAAEGVILVRFANRAEYVLPEAEEEEPVLVGYLEVAHMVEIELEGDAVPSDESIEYFIQQNVLFMAYPYFRTALHRLPGEFGLPAVVMPFLRREPNSAP
ncbi:hypothetical protein [Ornithinimicrobium pratense]|uniref:Preprotein translocase subunit SecB n=1 Tax=Ornithinimicrobium pratense TaxID=2593973 RepID=A0A5J6V676_9MICO|nr:hypothetical protein [Ornithinimicrobium pratense]QFG69510.1 hypothetical protein FY030_13075 [Ornithinimicrobium pratense]